MLNSPLSTATPTSRFMDIAGLPILLKRRAALSPTLPRRFSNVWLGLREIIMTEVVLCRGHRLHAVECAIVRLALKLPASPQDLLLDLWDHAGHLPADVVRLQQPASANCHPGDQAAAENALARLVLAQADTPTPLPSKRSAPDLVAGGVSRGSRRRHQPQVRFLTSTLLGVRWNATAQAAAGSEVYRLAWLPLVDRWVVTASNDVAGRDGYKDRLLATVPHAAALMAHASEIVGRYWQTQRRENGVTRWATCTESGCLTATAVHALAQQVWPAPGQATVRVAPAPVRRSLEPA